MNVGHALPTLVQALIFIAAVEVAPATPVTMIAASVAGAWLGAGVVTRMPLVTAAVLLALVNVDLLPGGGTALQLEADRLIIAAAANFALGALMTAGIGLYAPCLILVSPPGHEPARDLSHHDGIVCLPDARRRPALHSQRQI